MRTARVCLFVMAALLLTTTVRAQAPVTAADLSRLDSAVAEIDRQVVALKKTDPTLAADVDRSLTDLRDEVAYLKVKLRREGSVTRTEYSNLRDRLETLRLRSMGQTAQKVTAQPTGDEPKVTVFTVA
ncbi:MAG: hypothetical protein ACM4AI_19005, partial [Acidobacteriota bacterium]